MPRKESFTPDGAKISPTRIKEHNGRRKNSQEISMQPKGKDPVSSETLDKLTEAIRSAQPIKRKRR